MSDFSDLVSMIDNLKAEMFPRFDHLLKSIAALELDRIVTLEARVFVLEKMSRKNCIKWIEKMEPIFGKEMWSSSSIDAFINWLKDREV